MSWHETPSCRHCHHNVSIKDSDTAAQNWNKVHRNCCTAVSNLSFGIERMQQRGTNDTHKGSSRWQWPVGKPDATYRQIFQVSFGRLNSTLIICSLVVNSLKILFNGDMPANAVGITWITIIKLFLITYHSFQSDEKKEGEPKILA